MNTSAKIGKLDTIKSKIVDKLATNLPITTSPAVIWVVKRRFKVLLSRSPLMLPAVMAGTRNSNMTNSTDVANTYRLKKLEYWISAVWRTWLIMEYMSKRATRARMLLKIRITSGSLRDREPTMVSCL